MTQSVAVSFLQIRLQNLMSTNHDDGEKFTSDKNRKVKIGLRLRQVLLFNLWNLV